MATIQPSPTTSHLPRCMKYKSKYYQADDYLVHRASSSDPDKDKVRHPDPDVDTSAKEAQSAPLENQDPDKVAGKPHLGDTHPKKEATMSAEKLTHCQDVQNSDANYSAGQQRPPNCSQSFLQSLETPQSTQEICMTLLNMAFWRPDQGHGSSISDREGHQVNVQTGLQADNNSRSTPDGHPTTIAHKRPSENCYPESKRQCTELWTHGSGFGTMHNENKLRLVPEISANGSGTEGGSPNVQKMILVPMVTTAGESASNSDIGNVALLPNSRYSIAIPGYSNNTDNTTLVYTTLNPSQTDSSSKFILTENAQNAVSQEHSPTLVQPQLQQPWTASHHNVLHQNEAPTLTANNILHYHLPETTHNQSIINTHPESPQTHVQPPKNNVPERRRSFGDETQLSDTDSTSTTNTFQSVGSPAESQLNSSCGLKKATSLFPRPAKGRTLWDIVDIMSRRHNEDYFIGWSAEKILELPPDERPNVFPITSRIKKELVSKSVLTENKKLAFSFLSKENWGYTFRQNLRAGVYKTLSDAKRDASQLWRENCPEYDGSRAVRMRDEDGNIVMKRTRVKSGSEFEYRQNLRKAKVNQIVDQIWARRTVISEALQSDTFERLVQEMKFEIADYKVPEDKMAQIADVVAFSMRKELLSSNMDRVLLKCGDEMPIANANC